MGVVVFATILASVTLAEVGALHSLLEAFAVFLAAATFSTIATLEVPLRVGHLRIVLLEVLQDLLSLGEQVGVLLVIFLAQFGPEGEGVPHQDELLRL